MNGPPSWHGRRWGASPTRWITRDRANIAKHAKNSEALRNKMPYWFDVLEDSLGLKEDAAGPRPTEDGERRKLDQEANHA